MTLEEAYEASEELKEMNKMHDFLIALSRTDIFSSEAVAITDYFSGAIGDLIAERIDKIEQDISYIGSNPA